MQDIKYESFQKFFETKDIFGFNKEEESDEKNKNEELPVNFFKTEQMMEILAKKRVGVLEPKLNFTSEIQWGNRTGALRLEVSPKMNFLIKKLCPDLQGNPRWITKRSFQLDRSGLGGYEDAIANEIYDHLNIIHDAPVDGPSKEFKETERLVLALSDKMRRTAHEIFIYEGITKINDNNYLIRFGVRGQGVEAPQHKKVNEVQTQVTYDENKGSIRITNYKLQNKVGRDFQFAFAPSDLDVYFYPTQNFDEICEVLAVNMKYY